MTAGELPGGYADASVYTWVTFAYTETGGETRTLAVLRWTAFAALGTSGVPFEIPSYVTRLGYVVYNTNGTKSGSLPL